MIDSLKFPEIFMRWVVRRKGYLEWKYIANNYHLLQESAFADCSARSYFKNSPDNFNGLTVTFEAPERFRK